jgi:putative ABC transport system permease protein
MLKNYLLITLRNLQKYKGYSFINIFGLAAAVAVCLLILLYVQNELSYDKFNKNYDRIYRVHIDGMFNNKEMLSAQSCAPLAKTLKDEIPEVENSTIIRSYGYPVFRYKDKVFSEEKVLFTDENFFKIFDIEIVEGSRKNLLNNPYEIIITQSTAKKYFGNENPIGRSINSDKRFDYKIIAVIKDAPANSHIKYDFLGSINTYKDFENFVWVNNDYYTYILLKNGSNPALVQKKIDKVVSKYSIPLIEQILQAPWSELIDKGLRYGYTMQPLTDIHLKSNLENEFEPNNDIIYIYIFSIIAIGILIIACFNYMNLSTARYSGRAKEVGIRKTIGADFKDLVIQFLSESIILATLSVFLSIFIAYLVLPIFNDISGKQLQFEILANFSIVPILLLLIIFIGLVAGLYPAIFLASFSPIKVLGGTMREYIKGKKLRGILVVLQFSITTILIICTIFIYNQLNLLQNKKLGYQKEQILIINKCDDIGAYIQAFKADLKKVPGVINLTNTSVRFGEQTGNTVYETIIDGKKSTVLASAISADYDFIKTFNIKMIAGRFYDQYRETDLSEALVLNETAARELGYKKPVGNRIYQTASDGKGFEVIGIISNFNFESLKLNIKPLVIRLYNPNQFGRIIAVKLKGNNINKTVEEIRKIWSNYAGGQYFEYEFFDDYYNNLYISEERTGKLFASFSIIGIIIGCLGLIGLASFTAEKRNKEIGIRKALGASINSIFLLLSKEFIKYVLIANVIAIPVSYFLMSKWLENFAYKINLDIYVFIGSSIVSILIALLSVSYTSVKAASINPVLLLKYE